MAKLEPENWRALAQAHAHTRIQDKGIKLLRVFAARSAGFGAKVHLDARLDYPLIDAVDEFEMMSLTRHSVESGLLEEDSRGPGLTMKGWEIVQPRETLGGIPGRSFVAMCFDSSLNNAYELGIKAAIVEDCRLPEPIRMDREQHSENISDRMLAEIRLAQFVVADFTFQRGNVYSEAGFAMGLGRPVIWTCREDHFDQTQFDTQQYNHIVWKDAQDLQSKLRDRILSMTTIKGL